MEVVLQGALPTAARDAQRCKVSPSCVWMTTQASARGADDLSIWTTRRERSTDGTGADAGLYSLLATLPSISAHSFLADTEITDPHSFLLSTENTSFAAADAGECLVALGANDTVTILLSVRHTGNNDQDTKEQQSSDETQASSSSFKFEPLHDNSHVMKSTLHLDWLFADTVDAEVEDVQIVPISKQQFLVLSYPHFSIVTINAEEQRCTVEHVRTIDGDLSWTDVHCSRDARPLVCASGSELVLLHASHMVEVVDVSTTAAVAAVINLRTCCTIYRGLEWSSIAVGWQPRRLLVSSASEPVTIVIDIPAYFSSFPQHLRPGAAAPLVRRSHTDGSGCDALPVMSIDDYHNEWIEAVRARVDIDSGFTHGTMRGDETRPWAAAANQHDHDHDHDGHRDGGADVSVGEAQYNASVLDALNTTAASFVTAASHLPPPPRPHPFAHLLRSQGTAATHVHVRNRRATVIASGVQHTLSITIVDVVTLQSLTTVVLPPSTHVANSNPLLLVGPRGLTTLVLDLSQQQLLDQLTMLGRNDVAQLLCSQNGWSNNCYTSQLETSLKYRQIELVKEVLKTLTKDQLASACEMLVDAVSETWQFRDYLDFPIKLMHLTTRFIARKLEMFAATRHDAILVQLSSFMARLRRILPLAEGAADVSGGGGGGEEDARAGEDEETTPTPGQQAGEQPPTCLLSTQLSADRAVMCLRPHFTRDDLSSIPKTLVDTWEDLADPAAIIAHALKCNRLLHAQVYLAANRLDPALHSIANTQHHALAAAYAAVRRAHTQLAATYLSSAGIEPYGCFAEIVRTTLESDVRERLWQQLVDSAPHETLALEATMAIARDIEAMYPCASTEVAGVQRRKQQELPQLLFVLHFASMLAASTAQRERTPATGDKATGAKDKLDANSNDNGDNSSNAAANAAPARFEFRLRTLTDTEPDAEWWGGGDDDLPPSAAASVQSPLYSQVRLDFLDRMSDDGVDRLRAEALLTSHQVLALGEVDTDTMLSYWRVVRDACRHERFAFFTAPLRAACEAHEVTEDDITSLLDGMDTYSRLQAEKGFHGAGLFGLAYTLASDRDVRTLTRQIWRSGNVLADTRLSTVLPATALDAVKRHIAAVVTDNNFQLLALLLSRTNGWRWERNSPLEGVNFIDLNSAEDMTRYLQVQLSAKAAAAASNSGTPAAPTTPANETISTHAPAPVFDEDVDEPETTPELCHRLMRDNCLPSLLMLSAFDPGALQAAEGAEDVQLLLRAMNPTTPTPADGDLLLKLLQNATGTHARAVFAWLARTPAHTTDRVVSQDDVNSNNSNSSISGGARHWFVRRALPAFDSPELRSHALEDSLDFVFYIEQGRPLFAMQLFDREERGHLTPDATTRIYAAVMARPMHLPCVAAALSFLSRLEREDVATYLRQDVQAAQRLIQTRTSHKTSSIGSSNVLSQDQSSLMTSLFREWLAHNTDTQLHRHRAGQYLAALSRATQIILESKRGGHRVYEPDLSSSPSSLSSPSSSSIQTPADVIETWDLVLMIARRHGVVFVPDFLGYVDADNQWLFLTAYAQFYSVQPQHVIDVVQQQMNAGTTKEHVRAMLYKVVHTQPDTPTTAAAQTMVAHPHYTIPDGASDDAGNGLHLVDFLQLARDATQSCSASIPEVLLALAFRQRCPTMALLATCYGSNLTYTCLLVWLLTKLHSIGHVPLSAQLASIEADIVCEANGVCHLHIDSERGFSLCKEAIVLYIRLGFLNPLQDALGLFAEQAFKPVVKAIDLAHKHAERSATAVLHEEVKAGTTKGTWDALFLAFFKHTPTSLRAREILAAALRASNFPIADQHLHKRVHPNQQDGADTDKPSSPRTADAAVREAIAAGDFVDARARAIRAGLGTAAVDVAQAYEIAKKEVDIKTGSVHEENKRDDSLSRAIVTECLHHFERHSVDARTKALFFVSLVSAAFGVAEPHLPYATRVSGITKAADEALLLDTGLTLLPRSHHKMRSALRSIEVMLWQRRLEVQTYVINNTSGEPPIVPIDENETIGKRGWRGEEAQADKNPAHFKCPSRLLARSSNGYDEDDDDDEAVARVPESQERAFHLFLQVLLRRGSIGRAAHLCMLFNFYHPAIVAAQLSVYLAWETWTPDEAHPLAEEHLGLSFKEGDVEHCLQALVSAAALASACVARILANYRMAKKLCMPLQSFFSQEALKILRCAVRSEPMDKPLVREFIQRNEFSRDDVAEALASVFVDAVSQQVKSPWSSWTEDELLAFADLTGDRITFGQKLLATYRRRLTERSKESPLLAEAQLEVLRRAYTCFAGLCYMDGLQEVRSLLNDQVHTFTAEGNVLGLCQFLVSVRNIREFEFIIAHLYRTQHFEQLLRRGMSHLDEQTKLDFQSFLRDFLDRQPRSHYKAELQEILPIFFDVSADLGAMLMDKADRILSDFVPDKMDSPDFVDALIMCTETLADAASHFLKAGAPSDARTCAWRAQLCALQTQHDDQLLLLSTDEAKERMRTISSFGACRILGEHYMPAAGDEKYCEPVFHNVIVVPGMLATATSSSSLSPFATTTAAATSLPDLDPPRYWDEFKRHTTLTPLFFRDMQRRLKRFLHDAQPENEAPFKAAFAAILMDCPFLVELELMVKMMPDICTKRLRAKCSALAVVQSASKTVFDVTPAAFADHTATW